MIEGDDTKAYPGYHELSPTDTVGYVRWLARNVAPEANVLARGAKILRALSQSGQMMEGGKQLCELAVSMAAKFGLSEGVQNNLKYLDEPWDGKKSKFGVRGSFLPIGARVVTLAQVIYLISATRGPEAAQEMVRERRGKSFDPQVVDACLELSQDPSFWETLEQESLADTVKAMEPETAYSYTSEDRLDDICAAFAEFIDMKSPFTATHSRGVALVAEGLAKKLGLSQEELIVAKRAGLLHDMGKVSVPNTILDKKGKLSEKEWERMRLHPYYSERILTKVGVFRPLAAIAGAHHEWMNGNGYFRQLQGGQLSKVAHVISVADMFQALSEERPYRPALPTEQILEIMERETGPHLCAECVGALKAML